MILILYDKNKGGGGRVEKKKRTGAFPAEKNLLTSS